MNREFHPSSKLARSTLGFAAIVCSVLVVSGIAALADYYGSSTLLAIVTSQTHRA